MPVELELPKDLPEGTYQVVFSDWLRYAADEVQGKPFRFTAERGGGVRRAEGRRLDPARRGAALRLVRQPDGVAVGRTAMPHLPSSRRQILIGARPQHDEQVRQLDGEVIPHESRFHRRADLAITIDRDVKVEPRKPSPLVAPPTTTR